MLVNLGVLFLMISYVRGLRNTKTKGIGVVVCDGIPDLGVVFLELPPDRTTVPG